MGGQPRQRQNILTSRRGAVAIMFAVCLVPIIIAAGTCIDMARIATGRTALQRAADNAALSGAAAYVLYTPTDSYNAFAVSTAGSAFCNAVTTLPAGFTMTAVAGGKSCGAAAGPAVSAIIAGYRAGMRGTVPGSGCTSTNTVVAGATCGFVVTVSATATMDTIMPFLTGATQTVSVTASAVNPFINLATALTPLLAGSATNANSLWVYPLLLDANGAPDLTTNAGALPDHSACTGAPQQTSCGSYTMIASTKYTSCTNASPCNVGGTIFAGSGGVVTNPVVGNVVITATTPLGIAFESTAGGNASYGNNTGSRPPDGCVWPATIVYNTLTQVYDARNTPLLVDASGNWPLPTHWFFSSYLLNNLPPDQQELDIQLNRTINPATGRAFGVQDVPPVVQVVGGVNTPTVCPSATSSVNHEYLTTTYPTAGTTNCSLYVAQDPSSTNPDPGLRVGSGQTGNCWTPANTPGRQWAALSCQSFGGHSYVFFWNDMGGRSYDDTDYGNGTLQAGCRGPAQVVLIN